MKTIDSHSALQQTILDLKQRNLSIALVPTMGNLHAGHLDLIAVARKNADVVVASIFVNPLQFGANEDLDSYPRTLKADQTKLESAGCTLLFTPSENSLYPEEKSRHTRIHIPELENKYCGEFRPGHFSGVATVVCKLFNIVQPNVAIFGKKDYQQLSIIRKCVRDLCFPIKIIGVETTRNEQGLALSSRNSYLTDAELQKAPLLYQCLTHIKNEILHGNHAFQTLQAQAITQLQQAGFSPEYVNIVRQLDLTPAQPDDHDLVILAAARLGKARLIDNLEVHSL